MARRQGEGFNIREEHRVALTLHAVGMAIGLLACALANRILSPDIFWFRWVALGWGLVFAVHLSVFSRSTLASMTAKGRAEHRARREAAHP